MASVSDAPLTLTTEVVLRGGSMKEPLILQDIEFCSERQPYIKVSKDSRWLCLVVTGALPRKRPLAGSKIFDLLRDKVSAAWSTNGADVADLLTSEDFDEGDDIMEQGEEGDAFYILESGVAEHGFEDPIDGP